MCLTTTTGKGKRKTSAACLRNLPSRVKKCFNDCIWALQKPGAAHRLEKYRAVLLSFIYTIRSRRLCMRNRQIATRGPSRHGRQSGSKRSLDVKVICLLNESLIQRRRRMSQPLACSARSFKCEIAIDTCTTWRGSIQSQKRTEESLESKEDTGES